MTDYKVGDIVQLKSGGPKMTINGNKDSNGRFYCSWFAGSKLEAGVFGAGMLNAVNNQEESKEKK
jgi:uncharacterized protein YodC (DUF2158 family)